MMSIKFLFALLFVLVCVTSSVMGAKNEDDDPTAKAQYDIQVGMKMMQEAASNPALMAQLMRDLQVCMNV